MEHYEPKKASAAQATLRPLAEAAAYRRKEERMGEFNQIDADYERAYELAKIYHGIDSDAAMAMAGALPRGQNWSAVWSPPLGNSRSTELALVVALQALDAIGRGSTGPSAAIAAITAIEAAGRARAQAQATWPLGFYTGGTMITREPAVAGCANVPIERSSDQAVAVAFVAGDPGGPDPRWSCSTNTEPGESCGVLAVRVEGVDREDLEGAIGLVIIQDLGKTARSLAKALGRGNSEAAGLIQECLRLIDRVIDTGLAEVPEDQSYP
jgi:hypothetical protein